MLIARHTVFYFRGWYPRIAKWFDKEEYANSIHYGLLWLGIIRYK